MSDEHDGGADPAVVAYDRDLVPWLFEPWIEPFIAALGPTASSRVLDLACGTGVVSRHVVRRLGGDGRIDAVDIDPVMVVHGASVVVDQRVRWHAGDAADLPFGDDRFDRAGCHQGLQFMPDPGAVLAEVRRVLRPGGLVATATWGRLEDNPWPAALVAAAEARYGDEAGRSMGTVCRLGDPDVVAELLERAGFVEVTVGVRQRTINHDDVNAAVSGQLAALPSGSTVGDLDQADADELAALMVRFLTGYVDGDGRLGLPSSTVVATGRKP